ncbi:hypothetical protein COOONC_12272 [Cooperia oncophora]
MKNAYYSYENESDVNALAWIRGAGGEGGKSNFRAEMSSSFWTYFLEKGRQKLQEYNKKPKTSITSTLLAVRLGWEYSDWSGIPIKDLLSTSELKEYNVLILSERNSRKRDATGSESGNSSKMSRSEICSNE